MIQDHFDVGTWERVSFGKVVLNKNENTSNPSLEGLSRVVGLEHMDSESLPLVRWSELSDLPDGTTFTRKFRAGQVLFGKRRSYQKKVSFPDFDGICSGDILVFESLDANRMLPNFLPLLVQSDPFMDFAVSTSAGSLSPRTKWSDLSSFEFLLPPLKEQKVIVEIVAAIDKTIDAYKNLTVRSYRDSIVHELLSAVGDEWTETTLGAIATLKNGDRGRNYPSANQRILDGVPFINAGHLVNGKVLLDSMDYISEETFNMLSAGKIQEKDILYCLRGTVGKFGVVEGINRGAIASSLVILRIGKESTTSFISLFLDSAAAKIQLDEMRNGAAQPNLSAASLASFRVVLPPLVEQKRIVEVVSAMDEVNQSTEQAVVDAKALRSSILGEVFEEHSHA